MRSSGVRSRRVVHAYRPSGLFQNGRALDKVGFGVFVSLLARLSFGEAVVSLLEALYLFSRVGLAPRVRVFHSVPCGVGYTLGKRRFLTKVPESRAPCVRILDLCVKLESAQVARTWRDELGLKHVFFFQDTNPLVLLTVLASLTPRVSSCS